jgi:hypothetical protein
MFARVLGPLFVIVAATTVARADMRTLLSDFEANAAFPWVTGAFLLLASLVIIALHQYWRGAAAITVSVVGWVLALRAAFLMAFHILHGGRQRRDRRDSLMGERRHLRRTRRAVSNLRRLGPCTEPTSGTSGNINRGSPARRLMCAHG